MDRHEKQFDPFLANIPFSGSIEMEQWCKMG